METEVLNEAEVLRTLKLRLENSRIYTFVESSLLSMNPYVNIPGLYSPSLREFYARAVIEQSVNPRDVVLSHLA